jgi:UDP-N-acetylglucosamine 2-epimerase
MKNKFALDLVLGIRPDVIRASILIKKLAVEKDIDFRFIWSGQHYSNNLKDVFFQQLGVPAPQVELNAGGGSDSEIVSDLIKKLGEIYVSSPPDASIFLGDTNTVMSAIAAAQYSVPIVHIEGCMRSFDWSMPEEKYRTVVDHLSDVIYTYFDEYKAQGIKEGLRPDSIVVTQNLIVDVLNEYYFSAPSRFDRNRLALIEKEFLLNLKNYYVATIHRRENISNPEYLTNIFRLFRDMKNPVVFVAGYRTQEMIKRFNLQLNNTIVVDPVGYEEILTLITNSEGVITDSGTLVEECSVIGIPSIQARTSTERPQVYDTGGCLKFNPRLRYTDEKIAEKIFNFMKIDKFSWKHNLGDGLSSQRIFHDLMERVNTNHGFNNHLPNKYHVPISRAYMLD